MPATVMSSMCKSFPTTPAFLVDGETMRTDAGSHHDEALELRPISPHIGVELRGVDLSRPLGDEAFRAIRTAWVRHTILLVRDQAHLRPEDLIAFARRFGPLDEHDQPQYCLAGYPEIALVSNVKEGDRYIGAPKAGRQWHSDAQYLRTPPSASL